MFQEFTEEFESSARAIKRIGAFPKFCEWENLPDYSNNGNIKIQFNIKINPIGLKGDAASPFSHFLTGNIGDYNQILVVEGVRVYVIKEASLCHRFYD